MKSFRFESSVSARSRASPDVVFDVVSIFARTWCGAASAQPRTISSSLRSRLPSVPPLSELASLPPERISTGRFTTDPSSSRCRGRAGSSSRPSRGWSASTGRHGKSTSCTNMTSSRTQPAPESPTRYGGADELRALLAALVDAPVHAQSRRQRRSATSGKPRAPGRRTSGLAPLTAPMRWAGNAAADPPGRRDPGGTRRARG